MVSGSAVSQRDAHAAVFVIRSTNSNQIGVSIKPDFSRNMPVSQDFIGNVRNNVFIVHNSERLREEFFEELTEVKVSCSGGAKSVDDINRFDMCLDVYGSQSGNGASQTVSCDGELGSGV